MAYWLRRCATSRTVPGSIPGGVPGFFSDIFPSDHTMALGSTQPLVKMNTRNIYGGIGGWCVRVTTSPPLSAVVMKSGSLNFLEPSGPHRACYGTKKKLREINTFAASYLNTQGLNNSCLKSPASTLVDLTFQSRVPRSFSLNQLRNLSL